METTETVRKKKEKKPFVDCPFVVIIDTAEQQPFGFSGIVADSEKDYRPFVVPIVKQCLGRFPNSLGDYSLSLAGSPFDQAQFTGIGRCHIERKSIDDAHGTILGFEDNRRERFESELDNLSRIESGLVVVECSLESLLKNAPEYGKKTKAQNAKILLRSIIEWQRKFSVRWMFCESRRFAEEVSFWFLWKFWEHRLKGEEKARRILERF